MLKLNFVNPPRLLTQKQINLLSREIFFFIASYQKKIQKKLLQKKELTLVFLDEQQMAAINLQFRHKNKSTDVLSFDSQEPESLGELLFCVEVLKRQAKEQKHSFQKEFLYMLIHGILHLLGFDHEKSTSEARRMFKIQDECYFKILKKMTK
mgnify:CR=1 FL=1